MRFPSSWTKNELFQVQEQKTKLKYSLGTKSIYIYIYIYFFFNNIFIQPKKKTINMRYYLRFFFFNKWKQCQIQQNFIYLFFVKMRIQQNN